MTGTHEQIIDVDIIKIADCIWETADCIGGKV